MLVVSHFYTPAYRLQLWKLAFHLIFINPVYFSSIKFGPFLRGRLRAQGRFKQRSTSFLDFKTYAGNKIHFP
jgi:hypothetical protein